MSNKVNASIEIETSFYSDLSRMNISVEEALKEFIDNSTSSFEDNRVELEKDKKDTCKIEITWDDDEMIITDNAYGMEREEFGRALKLSARPDEYSKKSRSQYGIGLKNAAANIGRKYSIKSTQLGSSNEYYAEMDLDYLNEYKPKTVEVIIGSTWPEEHRTEIRIENLLQPFSAFNSKKTRGGDPLDKLLKQLGKAYSKDLKKKVLEITINGRKVKYERPTLLKDKETGTQYLASFEDSFVLNRTEYSYSGWIGILSTGDTAADGEAGFTLMKKDRAIQLNYRPEQLFGRSNDPRFQRVVGEIFVDDNWVVSFAKNRFNWSDNGLEQAFIDSITEHPEIMRLFEIAKKYRKNSENVSSQQIQKMNLDKSFKGLSEVGDKKPAKKQAVVKGHPSTQPKEVVEEEEEKKDGAIVIPYRGTEYRFHIIPSQDKRMKDKFIELKVIDPDKNEYLLLINARVKMFDKFMKKDEKELIVKMGISLALAQLVSKRLGLKEDQSQLFIDQINEIMTNAGE